MSYQATVLRVMLASPSDVSRERRIARDVVHEWNAVHSDDRRVVLLPVGWESHTSPEMGDRAQEIINRQILRDCDILIAVFWTRLGTPTGTAKSGTVEEIEEHIDAGKPALLYFSSAPVHPDSVDSEQFEALLEFKKSCKDRGLVEEYADLTEFREKLVRQLAQTVIRQFGDAAEIPAEAASRTAASGPTLSGEAIDMLLTASNDRSGVILSINSIAGLHIQSNGRQFVERGNPRSQAKWRAALDELLHAGLVEDRSGKGDSFWITDLGYSLVDSVGG